MTLIPLMIKNIESRLGVINKMIPKNKKGAEKTISVYWFVILILVSGAIIYMVSIFYGVPYDVSEMEANVLINVVADCLSKGGTMEYELNELEENFLNKCHLNLDETSDGRHYVEVSFSDFNTEEKLGTVLVGGNINLKTAPESMTSSKKSFYTLTKSGDKGLVVETMVKISKKI